MNFGLGKVYWILKTHRAYRPFLLQNVLSPKGDTYYLTSNDNISLLTDSGKLKLSPAAHKKPVSDRAWCRPELSPGTVSGDLKTVSGGVKSVSGGVPSFKLSPANCGNPHKIGLNIIVDSI